MRKNSVAALAILMGAAVLASPNARSQNERTAQQLPRAAEIPGVKPEVLARSEIPGVPGRLLIVARTTYEPGVRLRKHYHTSELTFYILEGTMMCQEEGKEAVRLNAGDFLLVKPGTIHTHWNASTTARLVFLEHVIVDQDQRSAVFME
jgi:quercetin dioxygenase-like cupin family protein